MDKKKHHIAEDKLSQEAKQIEKIIINKANIDF